MGCNNKIFDKREVKRKMKYLVRQKRYIIEEDTWKELENLRNTIELVEEFKKIHGDITK